MGFAMRTHEMFLSGVVVCFTDPPSNTRSALGKPGLFLCPTQAHKTQALSMLPSCGGWTSESFLAVIVSPLQALGWAGISVNACNRRGPAIPG